MNFNEWLRMAYGLFMGTSVQYIKPANRYMFPTRTDEIAENLWIQLGGSGLVGVLKSGDKSLLINCNQGKATTSLVESLDFLSPGAVQALVAPNLFLDFVGGFPILECPEVEFYCGKYSSSWVNRHFRDQLEPLKTNMKIVREEQTLQFGEYEVLLKPYPATYSEGDLVVILPKQKVVFLGGLFFNQIHPILRIENGMNVQTWMKSLEETISNYPDYTFIPAEGEVGSVEDLQLFLDYLRALTDESVEFSYCRKNFDWMEIPSHTSLEENFDLLRGIAKNFTTIE